MPKKGNSDGKVSITKAKLPTSSIGAWLTNVGKSIGYSTLDVFKETIPASMEIASEAATNFAELRESIKNYNKDDSALAKLQKGVYGDIARDAVKNTKEALKTGKFYDPSKEMEDFEDFDLGDDFDFGGDDDFAYIDGSDGFGEDVSVGTDSEDQPVVNNVKVKVDIGPDSPVVKSITNQTEITTSTATQAISVAERSSTVATKNMLELQNLLTDKFEVLNQNVGTVVDQFIPAFNQHAVLSAKYYNDNMEATNKILEVITAIKENGAGVGKFDPKNKVKEAKNVLDMFGASGTLDIKEYGNLVKKQLQGAIESNIFLSQLYSFGQETDTIKMLMKNPLKFAPEFIAKKLIPGVVRESMKAFDETLSKTSMAALYRIRGLKSSSNPIISMIGDIFGIDNKLKRSIDRGNYNRGKVDWDGESRKTLNEVIPFYLRKMTAAMTGQREIGFDYERGIFRSVTEMQEDIKREEERYLLGDLSAVRDNFKDFISKNVAFESKKDEENAVKDMEKFLINLVKNGDGGQMYREGTGDNATFLNAIAKMQGTSTDDNVTRLIASFIDGMRNSDVMRIFGEDILASRASVTRRTEQIESGERMSNEMYNNMGVSTDEHLRWIDGKVTDERDHKTKVAGTGGVDAHFKNTNYYVRQILKLLATGIRVTTVNDADEGGHVINHEAIHNRSQKILDTLKAQDTELETNEARVRDRRRGKTRTAEQIQSMIDKGMIDMTGDTADRLAIRAQAQDFIAEQNKREEDKKNEWFEKLTGLKSDQPLSKIINFMTGAVKRPGETLGSIFNKADNLLFNLVFGGGEFKREGSILSRATEGLRTIFGKSADFINNKVFVPLRDALFDEDTGLITQIKESQFGQDMAEYKDRFKKYLFGEKDDNGVYHDGLLSSTANELKEIGGRAKDALIGDQPNSVLSNIKKMAKNTTQNVLDAFGVDTEKMKNRGDKPIQAALDSVWTSVKRKVKEWGDTVLGPAGEPGTNPRRDFLDGVNQDLKGKGGKLAAGALVGGAAKVFLGGKLGFLGSVFLPGGFIGGALLGLGATVVKESETVKKVLFGDIDDETGRRQGGIISKSIIDAVENNKTGITVGAFAGLMGSIGVIPSFFVPGGPIGGALIGAGISMAYNLDEIQDFLFGPPDENGNRVTGKGILGKVSKKFDETDMKSKFLTAGIGAGVGLLGSLFFMPSSPLFVAALGAASAIGMTTDRFKNFMFGDWVDQDDHSKGRTGGLLGTAIEKVTGPIKRTVKNLEATFMGWMERAVVIPFKTAFKPIAHEVQNIKRKIVDVFSNIGNQIKRDIITPIKDAVAQLLSPVKKAVTTVTRALFRGIGMVLSSPFKVMQLVGYGLNAKHQREGRLSVFNSEDGRLKNSLKDNIKDAFKYVFMGNSDKARRKYNFGIHGASYNAERQLSSREEKRMDTIESKAWEKYVKRANKHGEPLMSREEFDEKNGFYNWTRSSNNRHRQAQGHTAFSGIFARGGRSDNDPDVIERRGGEGRDYGDGSGDTRPSRTEPDWDKGIELHENYLASKKKYDDEYAKMKKYKEDMNRYLKGSKIHSDLRKKYEEQRKKAIELRSERKKAKSSYTDWQSESHDFYSSHGANERNILKLFEKFNLPTFKLPKPKKPNKPDIPHPDIEAPHINKSKRNKKGIPVGDYATETTLRAFYKWTKKHYKGGEAIEWFKEKYDDIIKKKTGSIVHDALRVWVEGGTLDRVAKVGPRLSPGGVMAGGGVVPEAGTYVLNAGEQVIPSNKPLSRAKREEDEYIRKTYSGRKPKQKFLGGIIGKKNAGGSDHDNDGDFDGRDATMRNLDPDGDGNVSEHSKPSKKLGSIKNFGKKINNKLKNVANNGPQFSKKAESEIRDRNKAKEEEELKKTQFSGSFVNRMNQWKEQERYDEQIGIWNKMRLNLEALVASSLSYHGSWGELWNKNKGLMTLAILALSPIITQLISNVAKVLSGIHSVKDAIDVALSPFQTMYEHFKEGMEFTGGLIGAANRVSDGIDRFIQIFGPGSGDSGKELITNLPDRIASWYLSENTDENGNTVYEADGATDTKVRATIAAGRLVGPTISNTLFGKKAPMNEEQVAEALDRYRNELIPDTRPGAARGAMIDRESLYLEEAYKAEANAAENAEKVYGKKYRKQTKKNAKIADKFGKIEAELADESLDPDKRKRLERRQKKLFEKYNKSDEKLSKREAKLEERKTRASKRAESKIMKEYTAGEKAIMQQGKPTTGIAKAAGKAVRTTGKVAGTAYNTLIGHTATSTRGATGIMGNIAEMNKQLLKFYKDISKMLGEKMLEFTKKLPSLFMKSLKAPIDLVKSTMSIMKSAGEKVVSLFDGGITKILGTGDNVIGGLGSFLDSPGAAFQGTDTNMKGAYEGLKESVGTKARGLGQGVTEEVTGRVAEISDTAGGRFVKNAVGAGKSVVTGAKNVASNTVAKVPGKIGGAVKAAGGAVTGVTNGVKTKAVDTTKSIMDTLLNGLTKLKDFFASAASSKFGGAAGKVASALGGVFEKAVKGIKGMTGTIASKSNEIGKSLLNYSEGAVKSNGKKKVAGKVAGRFGKMLSSVTPVGVGMAIFGAVDAMSSPNKLFEIPADVKPDWKMTAIAGFYGAIVSTMLGAVLDIVNSLLASTMNFNLVKEIAVVIYNAIASEEEQQLMTESQSRFDQEYAQAVESDYVKWAEEQGGVKTTVTRYNEETRQDETVEGYEIKDENGETQVVTLDDYKKSGKAKTKSDYNAQENKTITSKVAEGIGNTIKDASVGKIFSQEYWNDETKSGLEKTLMAPVHLIVGVAKGAFGKIVEIGKGLLNAGKGVFAATKASLQVDSLGDLFSNKYWGSSFEYGEGGDELAASSFAKIGETAMKAINFPFAIFVALGKTAGRLVSKIFGKITAVTGKIAGGEESLLGSINGLGDVFNSSWFKYDGSADTEDNPTSPLQRLTFYATRALAFIPAVFVGAAKSIGKLVAPIIDPIKNMLLSSLDAEPQDTGELSFIGKAAYYGSKALQFIPKIMMKIGEVIGPVVKPILTFTKHVIGAVFTDITTALEVVDSPFDIFSDRYWSMKDLGNEDETGGLGKIRTVLFYGQRILMAPTMAIIGVVKKIFGGVSKAVKGFIDSNGMQQMVGIVKQRMDIMFGDVDQYSLEDIWKRPQFMKDAKENNTTFTNVVSSVFYWVTAPIATLFWMIRKVFNGIKSVIDKVSGPIKSVISWIKVHIFGGEEDLENDNGLYQSVYEPSNTGDFNTDVLNNITKTRTIEVDDTDKPVHDQYGAFLGYEKKKVSVSVTPQEAVFSAAMTAATNQMGITPQGNGEGIRGGFGDKPETVNGFPYYSQKDDDYANQPYYDSVDNSGYGPSTPVKTMGTSGCGPTAMSMVASAINGGFGENPYNPVTMADIATQYNYSHPAYGTTPGYFTDVGTQLGMNVTSSDGNVQNIYNMVSDGQPVIIQGASNDPNSPFTESGHYVVAVGTDSQGRILINDPRGKKYSHAYTQSQIANGAFRSWGFSGSNATISVPDNYDISSIRKPNSPNLRVAMGGFGDYSEMVNGIYYYNQGDSRWGSINMGGKTISRVGCVVCSFAMAISAELGKKLTPADIIKDKSQFLTGNSIVWGSAVNYAKKLGCKDVYHSGSISEVKNALNNGALIVYHATKCAGNVVGNKQTSSSKHAVLVFKDSSGHICVNDPGSYQNCGNGFSVDNLKGLNHAIIFPSGVSSSLGGSSSSSEDSSKPGISLESSDASSKRMSSLISNFATAYTNPLQTFLYGERTTTSTDNSDSDSSKSSTDDIISQYGSDRHSTVYNYLTKVMGMSHQGAAGVMGNFEQESGNRSVLLQNDYSKGYTKSVEYAKAADEGRNNFVKDSKGWGLAQWTYHTRKKNLLNNAKAQGKSVGDMGFQLDFLNAEMQGYPSLMNYLKSTKSVDDSVVRFQKEFERADKPMMGKRAGYAHNFDKQFGGHGGFGEAEDFGISDTSSKIALSSLNNASTKSAQKVKQAYSVDNMSKYVSNNNQPKASDNGGFGVVANTTHQNMSNDINRYLLESVANANANNNEQIVELLTGILNETSGTNTGINTLNGKEFTVKNTPIVYADNSTTVNNANKITNTKQEKTKVDNGLVNKSNYSIAKKIARGELTWYN